MIPSALVAQLQEGMKTFLKASFWSTNDAFQAMLDRFIDGEPGQESPLFRGPFLTLNLPFLSGQSGRHFFEKIPLDYDAHLHQEEAFQRLSGPHRQNTLVATGTGSGKTECFLMPILAHCEAHKHQGGIKALLIYPMNALAQDQAERIAREIDKNKHLDGVRVGLYVGSKSENPRYTMSPDGVITDKATLRDDPPAILLTNYKMLDYLLIRPRDQQIWTKNDPLTLQFLVVDELHTFDGAQGADLGSLLRRLRARLNTPSGHLTCIGTSATMGSGDDAVQRLLDFAGQVFGAPFTPESIIGEKRRPKDEFLRNVYQESEDDDAIEALPGKDTLPDLNPLHFDTTDAYLQRQIDLWFEPHLSPVELGEALRDHFLLERLLFHTRSGPIGLPELIERLRLEGSFRSLEPDHIRLQLLSFLALISHARSENDRPFLPLRLELWQREMRRMVATIAKAPALHFYDDLTREEKKRHLPVVYCRECGLMGWATLIDRDKPHQLQTGLQALYQAYFKFDSRVQFFFPPDAAIQHRTDIKAPLYYVCPLSLTRSPQPPTDLSTDRSTPDPLPMLFPENTKKGSKNDRGLISHHNCPSCAANKSLSLLGFQAASLTSTYINQLFASPYNDDKRLLTFSDSVQDAAHRAGFFEARTWRFNLRIAIHQALLLADDPLPLHTLIDRVEETWRHRLSDEEYITTFLAPDMAWLQTYQTLTSTGKLPKNHGLFTLIRQRLEWEIYSEYSFQSRIGRSLPRTGASLAYVDPERLEALLPALKERLANEVGGLQNLSLEHLRHFLTGFLRRLIEQGAIFQPQFDRTPQYISSGGENTFYMSQRTRHLPNFSPHSRLPSFVASRNTDRFHALVQRGSKQSWYERWFDHSLGRDTLIANVGADILQSTIIKALVNARILDEKLFGGTHIWGLRPDALLVTADLTAIQEVPTNLTTFIPTAELPTWLSMPSTHLRLASYALSSDAPQTHYAEFYRHGDIQRIIADEHTGLLEREAREEVETRFKADPQRGQTRKPWFPNLLSSTPTLEMGIDVGSLSSAVLCSIPPSQANYLQRIGRAGRRDGNSLILTLATARAHDLYFFAEPEEMIRGHVNAPGVFLNASAVLERQLTAYCFDRWAQQPDITNQDLPRQLGTILDARRRHPDTTFPMPLINFIEAHQHDLLSSFLSLFHDQLTDDSRTYLTRLLPPTNHPIVESGDQTDHHHDNNEVLPLRFRLLVAFDQAAHELKRQSDELRRTKKRLDTLKKEDVLGDDEQKEIEAIEQEMQGLEQLILRLKQRDTLEFLTSEGLLPNYAFPEAGVTLKSIIWRKTDPQERSKKKYQTVTYEFERPSRAAIRELVPRSKFFAGGRRVEINRVLIDKDNIETWQFCDRCHYSLSVKSHSEHDQCPQCASPGFANLAGQIHKMVRLRQVYANTNDRQSRIGDDSDERPPTFYNRQILVTAYDPPSAAWAIDDDATPFGYQYIPRTQLREINFGEASDTNELGVEITIANKPSQRPGFALCADCGMLQNRRTNKKGNLESTHTFGCPSRRKNYTEKIEECLFLYRDFRAEAVHILLPFTDRPGFETKLHSFTAAFQLGLKLLFQGKVDHIEATSFREPPRDGSGAKLFLVLYDQVPGGTGYLKDLVTPDEAGRSKIFQLLNKAQQVLTTCSCRTDPHKDGCYRCVLAYRTRFELGETSRQAAEEVLRDLLKAESKLQPIPGLGAIRISPLHDSPLEARFIEALTTLPGASLKSDIVQGHAGERLTLPLPDDQTRRWELISQVTLSDGLAFPISIDTQLICPDFELLTDDTNRPVAILADGFHNHQDRIGKDLFQRMSLVQSTQGWIWSLSYHDVESHFRALPNSHYFDLLAPHNPNAKPFFQKIVKDLDITPLLPLQYCSSFELLTHFLQKGPIQGARDLQSLTLALLTRQAFSFAHNDPLTWRQQVHELASPALADLIAPNPDDEPSFIATVTQPDGSTPLKIFINFNRRAFNELDPSAIKILVWLDDRPETRLLPGFQKTWNSVLHLYNLLQFLPNSFVITSSTPHDFDFYKLLASRPQISQSQQEAHADWEILRQNMAGINPAFGPLIDRFFEDGLPLPEDYFELTANGHTTSGPADLAWPHHQIALLDFYDLRVTETARDFRDHGWKVFDISDILNDPTPLLELF